MMLYFFALIGLSCGVIVAGGLFALITKLKLITRFADASHTKNYLLQYENAILLGAVVGNVIFLFPMTISIPFADIIFAASALFSGIFVGCLATALAEVLSVTAVFSRRLHLHSHLGFIILSAALGRLCGSLFYFFMEVV